MPSRQLASTTTATAASSVLHGMALTLHSGGLYAQNTQAAASLNVMLLPYNRRQQRATCQRGCPDPLSSSCLSSCEAVCSRAAAAGARAASPPRVSSAVPRIVSYCPSSVPSKWRAASRGRARDPSTCPCTGELGTASKSIREGPAPSFSPRRSASARIGLRLRAAGILCSNTCWMLFPRGG
jgi:hypothetical protein